MIFVSCRGSCLDRSFYRGASQWDLNKHVLLPDLTMYGCMNRCMEGFSYPLDHGVWGRVWGEVWGGVKKGGLGGVRTPPKMGVEIRGFFGGQKMVKNGQKRCGTEG